MLTSNYDNSAWFYDRLSRLVYGKALINAQTFLLACIKPNSSLLIVGGGTGWILEKLTQLHASGLNITYVEISEKMMAKSKARNIGNNQVTYINQAVQEAGLTDKFDVVITGFLFDNFKDDTVRVIFDTLHQRLKPNGLWLNTDFQLTGKWWQNLLLKTMLIFFRLLCNVESSALPNTKAFFKNYRIYVTKNFFGDFISSTAYLK